MSKDDLVISNIEEVHARMLADIQINRDDLFDSSIQLPIRCSKWLRQLHKVKYAALKSKQHVDNIKNDLELYYKGDKPNSQYKDDPLPHHIASKTLSKTALDALVNKDPVMVAASEQHDLHNILIQTIEFHLGIMKQNYYLVCKLIDYKRHQEGGF